MKRLAIPNTDIHDWQALGSDMRRCKTCGVYEHYFGCLREWRRDIPESNFRTIAAMGYFNLKGKYTYVSKTVFLRDGLNGSTRPFYTKLHPQPDLPLFKPN